ncbi:MAG: hypothetical protein H6Q13_1964 [Bacteroidetes bacterium]|nr:hypothetical protein [Bacteroidota bacterium]
MGKRYLKAIAYRAIAANRILISSDLDLGKYSSRDVSAIVNYIDKISDSLIKKAEQLEKPVKIKLYKS